MDWEATSALLDEKLDPKHVKKPSGNFGPKGDYKESMAAFATEYARQNHKAQAMAGVKVWQEKEAF